MSDSLQPQALQHTRFSCPSPFPRVCWNSCPLSPQCHPTISSSVTSISSCPQSFPASRLFPMSCCIKKNSSIFNLCIRLTIEKTEISYNRGTCIFKENWNSWLLSLLNSRVRLLTLSWEDFSCLGVYVQFCPKAGEHSTADFLKLLQAYSSLKWSLWSRYRYACAVLDSV